LYSSAQIESITAELRQSLGDNIPWQYEDKMAVMLSEFAQNKSDVVFEKLQAVLTDEWHSKTVKKMPKELKSQLGDLAKLSKNQKILAVPAQDSRPAIVALWWPWDHGGTYSLRLKVLEQSYDNTLEPPSGLLSWCKNWFS
jgi:hypothetical protein